MADEEIQDAVEETTETVETTTDPREEVMEYIEGQVNPKEEAEVATDRATEIPEEFASAAKAVGFSDEELTEFANDKTDEELKELIHLLEDKEDNAEEEETKEELPKKKEESDDQLDDKLAALLEKRVGPLLEQLEAFKETQTKQKLAQDGRRANELFDKAAEEFPIFGKTDELPTFPAGPKKGQLVPTSAAVKARTEVFDNARIFMQAGKDLDESMKLSLAMYKGLHLEKEVGRKLVQDLKNHEKKLSGPRVSKSLSKTYTDKREEILDEIRMMQRAAGMDT